MNNHPAIAEIDAKLNATSAAWPIIASELQERINTLTLQLVSNNDEQIRGRIKALMDLLSWPESLRQEREGISAGLSELDPAD